MIEQFGQEMAFGDTANEAASKLAATFGQELTSHKGRQFYADTTKIWTWKTSSTRYAARVDLR